MEGIDVQSCSVAIAVALLTLVAFPQLRDNIPHIFPYLGVEFNVLERTDRPKTKLNHSTTISHIEEESSVDIESEFASDWLNSHSIYELERRAIFSKVTFTFKTKCHR
jgi:hypothetical protein